MEVVNLFRATTLAKWVYTFYKGYLEIMQTMP